MKATQIKPEQLGKIAKEAKELAIYAYGEWRSSAAKSSKLYDNEGKETGELTFNIHHQVEIFGKAYDLQEVLTDEERNTIMKPGLKQAVDNYNDGPRPMKKGQLGFVALRAFGWSKFKKTYTGKMIDFYPEA